MRLLPGYAPVAGSIPLNVTPVNHKGQTVNWTNSKVKIKAFEISG